MRMRTFAPPMTLLAGALALALCGAPAGAQEVFATPEAAAEALSAAAGAGDPDKVFAIFGPQGREVLSSGAEGQDRLGFAEYHAAAARAQVIRTRADGRTVIYVGPGQWPFPVHLKKDADGWRFDLAGARDEILLRRIGENELSVIETIRAFVVAEREYMLLDPDGDQVMAYAGSFLSEEGARDGLYWPVEDGEPDSPFGPLAAQAEADGYVLDGEEKDPEPFHGYYFRILDRQGAAAPGGAMSYLVNGHQVAGFAMIAFPAAYGESGVMSFLVGPAGVIYEADLGEDTLEEAAGIDGFDPGEGWTVLEEG